MIVIAMPTPIGTLCDGPAHSVQATGMSGGLLGGVCEIFLCRSQSE